MGTINPKRFREIRIMRNITIEGIADYLGISKQAYSMYENGKVQPKAEIVEQIISFYDLPLTFLTKFEKYSPKYTSPVLFRKKKTKTSKKTEMFAVTLIKWASEIGEVINELVPIGDYTEIEFEESMSIEDKANKVRDEWNLGNGPIDNLTHELEKNGIRIFVVNTEKMGVDAYSQIVKGQPYIVINKYGGSAVRWRYNLAHELGHIVLHRNLSEINDKIEEEAYEFAGALLMPHHHFENTLSGDKLGHFVTAKKIWKVSIGAMLFRVSKLQIIEKERIKKLKHQLGTKRWIKREPLDDLFELEEPMTIKTSMDKIANDEALCKELLENARLPAKEVAMICGIEYEKLKNVYHDLWFAQEIKRNEQISFFDYE